MKSIKKIENKAIDLENVVGGRHRLGSHTKVRHHWFSNKTSLVVKTYSDWGSQTGKSVSGDHDGDFIPAR